MKVSIIWTEGRGQLVLHPETPYETEVLNHVVKGHNSIVVHQNVNVFECRGEYIRQATGGEDLAIVFHHPESIEKAAKADKPGDF